LICSCLTKYNSFMFRKQIVIIGVTALVSLVTGSSLSVTRFDDHDGAIERSLQGDNKCKVAVKTRCTIGNTKANCEGHFKAKKKWCAKKANGKRRRIPVTLMLKWEVCNMNENNVLPDADKTHARYNSWEKKINFRQKYLPADKCLYLQSKKKFNLCSRGFTMSMQYAGKQINKGSKNSYCYAYEYKKIKKEWIKDKNEAAITTKVTCKMKDTKENCAGNIIKNAGSCIADVILTYESCHYKANQNDVLKIRRNGTFIKIRGNKHMDMLNTEKMFNNDVVECRNVYKEYEINTCEDSTTTMMVIKGSLNESNQISRSKSTLVVHSAEECITEFIITEVYRNKGKSFVELYTSECQGQIITENIWLVKIDGIVIDEANPINLKGVRIPEDGFVVLCVKDGKLDGTCDIVTGSGSAVKAKDEDTIALITIASTVNKIIDNNEYIVGIIDSYGGAPDHVIRDEDGIVWQTMCEDTDDTSNCPSPKKDAGTWHNKTSAPVSAPSSGDARASGTSPSKGPKEPSKKSTKSPSSKGSSNSSSSSSASKSSKAPSSAPIT